MLVVLMTKAPISYFQEYTNFTKYQFRNWSFLLSPLREKKVTCIYLFMVLNTHYLIISYMRHSCRPRMTQGRTAVHEPCTCLLCPTSQTLTKRTLSLMDEKIASTWMFAIIVCRPSRRIMQIQLHLISSGYLGDNSAMKFIVKFHTNNLYSRIEKSEFFLLHSSPVSWASD